MKLSVAIARRNHDPLIHALKMISLASSLICLVLTQTAILSFADDINDTLPTADGMIGIIMGSIAALIGVSMIIRIAKIGKDKNCGRSFSKIKKPMKKMELQ